MTDAPQIKRFYKDVSLEPTGEGYGLLLDGRNAKTAKRNIIMAPNESLGVAVRQEWEAQDEHIDRRSMPLTAILSLILDTDEATVQEWRSEIKNYLMSDLLCYRAEKPDALAARQAKIWDPYLAWFNKTFGVNLECAAGVIAIEQPREAGVALENWFSGQNAHCAFPVMRATSLTGSAVLALALWSNSFDGDEIFAAGRLDETFQAEQWGVDEEASAREAEIKKELELITRYMRLIQQ